MAFELKDNSMSLLKNGFKKDGDNKPDYTGSAKVDGVDMKASLWVNKTKDGKTLYMAGPDHKTFMKKINSTSS